MAGDTPETVPMITTGADFRNRTSIHFNLNRSKEWQNLAAALDLYNEHRAAYARSVVSEIPTAIVEAYAKAATSLSAVSDRLTEWGEHHKREISTQISQNLRVEVEQARRAIRDGMKKLPEAASPDNYTFAWVGSPVGRDATKALHVWASTHPQGELSIVVDPRNLLSNDYRQASERLRENSTSTVDPAFAARAALWQGASLEDWNKGLDARLADRDPAWRAGLETRQAQLKALPAELAKIERRYGCRIKIRDVRDVFHPPAEDRLDENRARKPAFRPEDGALSQADRNHAWYGYQFELQRRFNPGAGADLIRILDKHDRAGKYYDVDVTPPVRGFDELVKTWNDCLHGSLKQCGYEQVQEDNLGSMVTRANRDRKMDTPPFISLGLGAANAQKSPTYPYLAAAVHEHINNLIEGAGQPQATQYNALMKFIGDRSPERRKLRDAMAAALSDWSRKTQKLEDAFTPVKPILVRPDLFKLVEVSPINSTSNNNVVATSMPGSAGLATWLREINYRHHQAQNLREYLDDSQHREYVTQTCRTTGPFTMSSNKELLRILQADFGVTGERLPLLTIPYTHFPHPSDAAAHISWTRPDTPLPQYRRQPLQTGDHPPSGLPEPVRPSAINIDIKHSQAEQHRKRKAKFSL